MPPEVTYDYAIIRVVPRVERGEQVNVGVILSCVDGEFLEVLIEVDEARLRALDPTLDLGAVRAALDSLPGGVRRRRPTLARSANCRREAGSARSSSPRSTVVQVSPVHTGRTADPAAAPQRLFERMVRTPLPETAELAARAVCGSVARNSGLRTSAGAT